MIPPQPYDKYFHLYMENHMRYQYKVMASIGFDSFEGIIHQSALKTGRESYREHNSHASGTDNFISDGNVSAKTTTLDVIRYDKRCTKNPRLKGTSPCLSISSYRTQRAIHIYPDLDELPAKIAYINSIKFKYYVLMTEQVNKAEGFLHTVVYWMDPDFLKIPPHEKWEAIYNEKGNLTKYRADEGSVIRELKKIKGEMLEKRRPTFRHEIRISQSHQLWHEVDLNYFHSIVDNPDNELIIKAIEIETPLGKLGIDFPDPDLSGFERDTRCI